ncbi:hypothetical protein BH10PLA1_BH10PLA1_19400 [soil metagenome]
MLEVGTAMYLLLNSEGKERVLRLGKVVTSSPTAFSAEFGDSINCTVGNDMIVFAESRGRFFQQGVSVTQIQPAEQKIVIDFLRVGDLVSAEQRQTFRVSVVTKAMEATIDKETDCKVVDLSPEGFGAIVEKSLALGSLVPIAVSCDGKTKFTATARVQTIKILPDGSRRYGFLVPDKKSSARKAMQEISSTFQREQLRRLAGAAA